MAPGSLALLAYSAQILVVVGVAAIAATFVRLEPPLARLTYWRAVGGLCLALPLMALLRPAPAAVTVLFDAAALAPAAVAPEQAAGTLGELLLWVWVAGAAARLAWLGLGAIRLRRIRARSTPFADAGDLDSLRTELAPHASFRWTSELAQPATFGVRHPVVLVPPRFATLGSEARRAVACHELLHVARRDWVWILAEEYLRALLWFHPAVWWVLEHVHLSREQLIDGEVVKRTASRRPYMDALMTFADSDGARSPAMAFLRRRHLASRLRQLSKESHMSLMRLVWTSAVLGVLIAAAAGGIVMAVPLDLPGLGLQSQSATQLEIKLAETKPAAGLTETRAPGSSMPIYLHPSPIATGADVTSARVVPAAASRFSVAVEFNSAASARMSSATREHIGRPVAVVLNGRVVSAPTLRSPIGGSATITGDFTQSEAESLASALTPAGTPGNAAANRAVSQPVSGKEPGVLLPVVLREVKPAYTQSAMAEKIQGEVHMSAVVLPDGTVGDVTVTRSLDAVYGLDEQAVDAVKQWNFKPGTKNGVPVAVRVDMMIRFTLK